jgi:type VI secretion system secreted protein VgrG
MKKFRPLLGWVALSVCLQAAQLPVNLGSAGTFTALAGSTVTNTGPTIVNGDVGVSPGSAVTGFPPGSVVGGAIHAADGPAALAQGDLTTAYNDAAGRATPVIVAGDLGGQTLPAGLYKSTSSLGITGVVTLDGGGNPNSVFIFQIASALTTASGSQVVLIGGANAANIFWQVGSSATLGTNSIFNGTILAQASVTIATGAALDGRALARTGAVTLDSNLAVNPGPPTSTTPSALSVACPLNIAQSGIAYASLLVATGGTPPYTFSTTGALPPGLLLNAATGAVTGAPTTIGSASFAANVLDSATGAATSNCAINTTAANQADVSIIKSGPASAGLGSNITFNIAVANAGPNTATGVTVTDVLPAGVTFVSATPSQGSCSGTSAVVCSMGSVPNGGSATVALVVTSPATAGPVVNTALVSAANTDPNIANNSSTATVSVPSTVPTLSTWGLVMLALLLAGCAARLSQKAHRRSMP